MYLVFLFIASVQAYCTYPHPNILYCNAITTFPDIKERNDIVYIDIQNSTITELPLFTKDRWPKLEFLTFMNNRLLPCKEIQKQIQDHIFYIDHDCIDTDIKNKPKSKDKQPIVRIILPVTLCIIAIGLAAFIIIKVTHKTPQDNHDCAFQSV